jgi:ribulose-5-phosphate 4-epimerase/fuculose-1-phosphate aldolase
MKAFSLLHPRNQIVAIMDRIYGHEMTTTSGGNVSVRDENGDVWITPARVDKGNLRRQDIVRIGPSGEREGLHPPSSENPFHLSVYKARPDLRAVIHAHPGALVSFSICGQAPNTRLFPEAWHVCGEVAFAPYALPGSIKLGNRIAEQFGSSARPNCAHRLVTSTWGSFSARVDGDTFVVTPSHVDRCELGVEDLVFVRDGKHAPDQKPSRALGPISAMGEAVIEELLGVFPGV